jgi:hypothetical protein
MAGVDNCACCEPGVGGNYGSQQKAHFLPHILPLFYGTKCFYTVHCITDAEEQLNLLMGWHSLI